MEEVWLDEFHGLRISIRGHEGKWPISTIKMAQRWRLEELTEFPPIPNTQPRLKRGAVSEGIEESGIERGQPQAPRP